MAGVSLGQFGFLEWMGRRNLAAVLSVRGIAAVRTAGGVKGWGSAVEDAKGEEESSP